MVEADVLHDRDILHLLSGKSSEGVRVSILLNGAHLSEESTSMRAWTEDGYGVLSAMVSDGADVRYINAPGCGSPHARFSSFTSGFMVIDDDAVVLTSQDWTGSWAPDMTIAWGAVVRSGGYAAYMADVFEQDRSYDHGDVMSLADVFPEDPRPDRDTSDAGYTMPLWDPASFASYSVEAIPVMSSEGRYDALDYYSGIATTRLYAEQGAISDEYRTLDRGPLSIMSAAASRGTDARIMLSSSAGPYEVLHMINTGSSVGSAMLDMQYFGSSGVIADDVVLLSTGAWSPGSFESGRYPCVAIVSRDVADLFASVFEEHYDPIAGYEGFTVTIQGMKEMYSYGQRVELTAHVNPSGEYTYSWGVLGDSDQQPTGETVSFDLPFSGRNVIYVAVTDGTGHTFYDRAEVYMDEKGPDHALLYAIIGIVVAIAAAAVVRRVVIRRMHGRE